MERERKREERGGGEADVGGLEMEMEILWCAAADWCAQSAPPFRP